MSVLSVAESHQARRVKVSDAATVRALQLWRGVDINNLDVSWNTIALPLTEIVSAAQMLTVSSSDGYAGQMARLQNVQPTTDQIVVSSFVGIDGSGRDVESLLHGAVTTTKQAIGAGFYSRALESGAAYLATMISTAIADMGRSGDMVAGTAKNFTQYVRVLSPGACSRCAILAGKSSYKIPFKRHPRCKCTTAPINSSATKDKGLFESAQEYFDSLSSKQQDRIFTKGGAEAIRSGADPATVISARRGATGITTSRGVGRGTVPNSGRRIEQIVIGRDSAGNRVMGYVTSEGTTVRGAFARQQRDVGVSIQRLVGNRYSTVARTRLMPETIVSLTDDLELRQVLLRDAGYMERPITAYYGNGSGNSQWLAERRRLQAEDHIKAETFYRSLGIYL